MHNQKKSPDLYDLGHRAVKQIVDTRLTIIHFIDALKSFELDPTPVEEIRDELNVLREKLQRYNTRIEPYKLKEEA